MSYNYETPTFSSSPSSFACLEPSFTFNDSLLVSEDSIDDLYNKYLVDADQFTSDPNSKGQLEINSYPYDYESGMGYPTTLQGGLDSYPDLGVTPSSTTRLPVSAWQGEDCLNWATSVCSRRGLDTSTIDQWSFRNSTGAALQQFSVQHFSAIVGDQYGRIFFNELQALSKQQGLAGHSSYEVASASFTLGGHQGYTSEDFKGLDQYIPESKWDTWPQGLPTLESHEDFMPIKYEMPQHFDSPSLLMPPVAGASTSSHLATSPSAGDTGGPEGDVFKKIPTNTRRKERGPKSWEFLVRLLADKRMNPTIIRWEDEANGTFRFTQPEIIARMWGARAGKPNLAYVNFARGLRYHYNTGALEAVSERQLVYKCGPKAMAYLQELKSSAP